MLELGHHLGVIMGATRLPAVLIIDVMELRRAGLVALVEPWASDRGIATVPIPPSELGVELVSRLDPRFVILGIGGASLHAAEPMHWASDVRDMLPGVPCVVVSDRTEPEEAIFAARLGHQAFMTTSMEPQIALQAFAFVIGGGTYFPREALLQSASAARDGTDSGSAMHGDGDRLTRRQHEVLDRLRLGKSNKLIARDLDMQESTVKVHVRQIMRKLGASNRTQAALLSVATRPSVNGVHAVAVPNGAPVAAATLTVTQAVMAAPADVGNTAYVPWPDQPH
jgi:DNA-binding NarL/FixJ family response regulator